MSYRKYIVILICLSIISCSKIDDKSISSITENAPNIEEMVDILNEAYKSDNIDLLNTYFKNWHQGSKPITLSEYDSMSKNKKHIYSLYKAFYHPYAISKNDLSREERNTVDSLDAVQLSNYLIYSRPEYIVLQNRIDYGISKYFFKDFGKSYWNVRDEVKNDSLINFRPNIKIEDKLILFYDGIYYSIFYKFLLEEFEFSIKENTPEEIFALERLEFEKKVNFLKPKLTILSGHWGGIHIKTLPNINFILFSQNYKLAKIYYRKTWYSGGEACYFRIGNFWIKIFDRDAWIE